MEIRSADEAMFRQVYDEVFPVIYKVAYHVMYDADLAEEICQDAFVRFYDKDITLPSLEDVKFWLIRVTKNLAINHIKRKGRESAFIEKIKKTPAFNPYNDGQAQLILEESKEAVRKAVSQLPEIYKTVIVLKEYGDLNYKAISKILDISESNVKVRVHRARKELEALLTQEVTDVS